MWYTYIAENPHYDMLSIIFMFCSASTESKIPLSLYFTAELRHLLSPLGSLEHSAIATSAIISSVSDKQMCSEQNDYTSKFVNELKKGMVKLMAYK